jgi:hypothetical protein
MNRIVLSALALAAACASQTSAANILPNANFASLFALPNASGWEAIPSQYEWQIASSGVTATTNYGVDVTTSPRHAYMGPGLLYRNYFSAGIGNERTFVTGPGLTFTLNLDLRGSDPAMLAAGGDFRAAIQFFDSAGVLLNPTQFVDYGVTSVGNTSPFVAQSPLVVTAPLATERWGIRFENIAGSGFTEFRNVSVVVPEPGSLVLLGAVGLITLRRRSVV